MFGVAFLLLHCSLRVRYAALLLLCTASTYRFANSTSTLTVMAHIQSHHHTLKQSNLCGHHRIDKQLIRIQVGSEWPGSQPEPQTSSRIPTISNTTNLLRYCCYCCIPTVPSLYHYASSARVLFQNSLPFGRLSGTGGANVYCTRTAEDRIGCHPVSRLRRGMPESLYTSCADSRHSKRKTVSPWRPPR